MESMRATFSVPVSFTGKAAEAWSAGWSVGWWACQQTMSGSKPVCPPEWATAAYNNFVGVRDMADSLCQEIDRSTVLHPMKDLQLQAYRLRETLHCTAMTKTYALMPVSRQTYKELRRKLLAAGYEHCL